MQEDPISILKEKSTEPDDRFKAILHLMDGEPSEILPLFDTILCDESDTPDVRAAIALALGKIASEGAIDVLIGRSSSIENPDVRRYIMDALGTTRSGRAIPILIRALQDKDNNVFASAAEALGRIGDKAVPHLINLLDDGADDARCVAAWQLGEIRNSKASPKLAEVVLNNKNVEVTALSIWAIGKIGAHSEEVMKALYWAKNQEDPDIRLRADLAIKRVVQNLN